MRYISTRGGAESRRFCGVLLEGLAPDGGLYVPEYYPVFTKQFLESLRDAFDNGREFGYAKLAFMILSELADDIPRDDLWDICRRTYTKEKFGTHAIAPVTRYDDGGLFIDLLHLSNGPTLAFKDKALQLLGNLFEYQLARTGRVMNTLGATSGDTGSAAEYALRGKKGVNVFMLSPYGRMSPFQQAQMYSLQDENIFNIAVEGTFDDAQAVVKEVSNDLDFKRRYSIGSVNSINWARLAAQVVYCFAGYFQSTKSNNESRVVSVPSGNFGHAFSWHMARKMGLPISHIIVATNENDVLDEFFKTGMYRPRPKPEVVETSSPSMDIALASNLERLIHMWLGSDVTRELYNSLSLNGHFSLVGSQAFADVQESRSFISGRSTHADRIRTIREVREKFGAVIDPHTADAWFVAENSNYFYGGTIVPETAHPAKFEGTIVEALGKPAPVPEHLQGIEALSRRVVVLPPNAEVIKKYIADRCA